MNISNLFAIKFDAFLIYCKGTVTDFFFFFLSYYNYVYRSLLGVPFCISVELNQMSHRRDTKSQLHRVQRRFPVPLSRRSVEDIQFWNGSKNVCGMLKFELELICFFFFFFSKYLICWNVQWLTNPLSVRCAAPVWRKCVLYVGIPSIQSEENTFLNGCHKWAHECM